MTSKNTLSCLLCGFDSKNKLTFSCFPQKHEKKKLWLEKCNLGPEVNVSKARLCCKHFKEDDFKVSEKGRRLLKSNAVPSVFFNNNNAPVEKATEPSASASKRPKNYFRSCIICRRSGKGLSLHRLPRNEDVRNQWLAHFNIESTHPRLNTKDPRICELHFLPQPSETVSSCHRRKKKELPGLHQDTEIVVVGEMPDAESVELTSSHQDEEMIVVGEIPAAESVELPGLHQDAEVVVVSAIPAAESVNLKPLMEDEVTMLTTTASSLFETPMATKKYKKSSLLFPRYPNDIKSSDIEQATPRIKRSLQVSREYIQKQRNMIVNLRQQVRRGKQKIKNLKDILQYLLEGNFVNQEIEDRLLVTINSFLKTEAGLRPKQCCNQQYSTSNILQGYSRR